MTHNNSKNLGRNSEAVKTEDATNLTRDGDFVRCITLLPGSHEENLTHEEVIVMKEEKKTIKIVVRYPDNIVVAFNNEGELIPEYHEQYEKIRDKILKDAPPEAIFFYVPDYADPKLRKVPRQEW